MSDSGGNNTDERVVIEQRLLKIDEIFIYRIPPMRSADGHRAEDWNLAKPLATCSLVVARRDNDLCVNIMAERPKEGAPRGATENYLFAQSNIRVDLADPSHNKIEHWVNPVVDSSRYFALRIKDGKSGREAFIGVGFRERTDAVNFRMSIEDYINSLKREEKAAELQREFEQSLSVGETSSKGGDGVDVAKLPLPKSSLSLAEGEKMHINIKSKRAKPANQSPKSKTGGLIGLKKPPPPPPVASPASDEGISTTNSNEVEWGEFEG